MLEELRQAIIRLESSSLSSLPLLLTLKRQHERFITALKNIRLCENPKVMRILTEEALEAAECMLLLPAADGTTAPIQSTHEWGRYVAAVSDGMILDSEYTRFLKAKHFADRLLDHSYMEECEHNEYKAMRYEYALSPDSAPAWFQTDMAALWVEEIITAYCFLLFSVLDFAEENGQAT